MARSELRKSPLAAQVLDHDATPASMPFTHSVLRAVPTRGRLCFSFSSVPRFLVQRRGFQHHRERRGELAICYASSNLPEAAPSCKELPLKNGHHPELRMASY